MEDAIKTQNILTCKNFCMYFELPFIKLGYLWKGKKSFLFGAHIGQSIQEWTN